MRLATFNIYWLGNKLFVKMSGKAERTDDDWRRIAQVITRLNADVLAFQEIISKKELQTVLGLASSMTGRSYQPLNANKKLLGEAKPGGQKVIVTYDARHYELVAAAPISGGGKGLAFGLRLKGITGSEQVTVVGVHLKSGQPSFTDVKSATTRRKQCRHLQDWVTGKTAGQ